MGWTEYEKDPREACKYGEGCYQKNTKHQERFKHPPKRTLEGGEESEPINKRITRNRGIRPPPPPKPEPKTRKPKVNKNNNNKTETEEKNAISNGEDNSKSEEVDENMLPPSPLNVRESIKQKFLVSMPEDFYFFWEFCRSLNPSKPEDALKAQLNLTLVGPYDVLSGKLKKVKSRDKAAYLRHWRYYYDPPEFQTIIAGDPQTQFHIGYFRDDPNEMPVFVASNSAAQGSQITLMGPNIFSALNSHISAQIKQRGREGKTKLDKLHTKLQEWASSHDFPLATVTPEMNSRNKKVVARSFHGAGIVVPYDTKTEVGYRPLPETNANLKKILQKIVSFEAEEERMKAFDNTIQEIITFVQFANDECDYGMGLELGIGMFCFGHEYFHSTVLNLLTLAYTLLNRSEFGEIIKAHLADRKKSGNVSIAS